jgi:hypothetical protein
MKTRSAPIGETYRPITPNPWEFIGGVTFKGRIIPFMYYNTAPHHARVYESADRYEIKL